MKSIYGICVLVCFALMVCVLINPLSSHGLRELGSTYVTKRLGQPVQPSYSDNGKVCILGYADNDTMAFRSHLQWSGSFVSIWSMWGTKPQSVQQLGNSSAKHQQVAGYGQITHRIEKAWRMPMYTFDCSKGCSRTIGLEKALKLSRELHVQCEYFFTTDDDTIFRITEGINIQKPQPSSKDMIESSAGQFSTKTLTPDRELERVLHKWRPAVAAFPWALGDRLIRQCQQVAKLFNARGKSEVIPLTCFDGRNVIYHASIVDFFIPFSPGGESGFGSQWQLSTTHLMLFAPNMFRHNALRIQTLSYSSMKDTYEPVMTQMKSATFGKKTVNNSVKIDHFNPPMNTKYGEWLATGLKHHRKNLELYPHEIWWAPERGHPPYNDDILLRISSFFDTTHPAIREKIYIRNLYSHEQLRRFEAYPFRIKLIIFTQYRLNSFKRLWTSIKDAWYPTSIPVDVSINVDAHPNQSELLGFIQNLSWPQGMLNVRIYNKPVGLKLSTLNAWSPSMPNEYGIFLQDDVEVSPLYMHWAVHGIMQFGQHDASDTIVAREQWYTLRNETLSRTHADKRVSAVKELISNPPSRLIITDAPGFTSKLQNILDARKTLQNELPRRLLKIPTTDKKQKYFETSSSLRSANATSRSLRKQDPTKSSIHALISHHERKHSLVGVSLYIPKWNQVSETTFQANTSNMPFVLQAPSSWGAVYFPLSWQRFRLWMQQYGHIDPMIPYANSNFWLASKSWKKYLLAMMAEEGLGMVYPNLPRYRSLSTKHIDTDTNIQDGQEINTVIRSRFQVPLLESSALAKLKSLFRVPLQLHQLPIYDVYHRQVAQANAALADSTGAENAENPEIYLPHGIQGTLSALTVVMPIFDRRDMLRSTLEYHSKCPCVEHIVIIDNNVGADPIDSLPDSIGSMKITYHKSATNSLNNRFAAVRHANITTLGILSLDDDVRIQYNDICRAFSAWQLQPHRILGFRYTARAIRPHKASWMYDFNLYRSLKQLKSDNAKVVALTGAAIISAEYFHVYSAGLPNTIIPIGGNRPLVNIEKYAQLRNAVDIGRNGEDLAMNMLIANFTNEGPLIAEATINEKLMTKLPGLSKRRSHRRTRHECLQRLVSIYNKIPLLPADIIDV